MLPQRSMFGTNGHLSQSLCAGLGTSTKTIEKGLPPYKMSPSSGFVCCCTGFQVFLHVVFILHSQVEKADAICCRFEVGRSNSTDNIFCV